MAEQGRNTEPWIVFVAAAMLVTGGGLFFGKPFESSRHKETIVDSLSVGTVPARLWQDPFTAIARCKRNKTTDSTGNLCVSAFPKPLSESQETQEKNAASGLIIMPIMVYGDAYSESVEKRRRRRYAVLSAMFILDYQPINAQTINYFEYEIPRETGKEPQAGQEIDHGFKAQTHYVVPFEWLLPNTARYQDQSKALDQKKTNRHSVLLLWLDERRFGKSPLKKLARLLRKVEESLGAARKTKVTLLGPAGSTVLRDMVHEASDLVNKTSNVGADKFARDFKRWRLSIFSPVATASAKLIIGEKESEIVDQLGYRNKTCKEIGAFIYENPPKDGKEKAREFGSLVLLEQIFEKIGVKFFRTISSDKALLRLVVNQEFQNRNPIHNEHVTILISEWDTFYGRSLPEAFVSHIKRDPDTSKEEEKFCWNGDENKKENKLKTDEKKNQSEPDEEDKSEVGKQDRPCLHDTCQYVYMRGLDGEILDRESSKDATAEKGDIPELERAVGVNRFDYLRRLVHRIKNDFYGRAETVRVVGILGSDVYDKLLVLQALRASFHDALFFVTDADARYLHPSEFEWTRGLVVMSGYGLKGHQVVDISNEKPSLSPGLTVWTLILSDLGL